MADLCCVYTVAGITFNEASPADTYIIQSIDGLDGVPIRRTVVNVPQDDGGLALTAFAAPRRITIEGEMAIRSTDPYADPTGFLTALNTLEFDLWQSMDGILNTPGTLAWSPTGLGASITLSVKRDDQPVGFRGTYPVKGFIVSLIAEDPEMVIT